jgi:hypothetical protein
MQERLNLYYNNYHVNENSMWSTSKETRVTTYRQYLRWGTFIFTVRPCSSQYLAWEMLNLELDKFSLTRGWENIYNT